MKVTKEQANKLLTEIKEVLAKDIDYTNFTIVQTKDGLTLAARAKTNIVLEVNVTRALVDRVKLAKETRKLTLYTQEFPDVLNDCLTKKGLKKDQAFISLCEDIVRKADKINEFLDIIYSLDISSVKVAEKEPLRTKQLNKAEEVLHSEAFAFSKTNHAFYPKNYRYLTKRIRDGVDKYKLVSEMEPASRSWLPEISKLLAENKMTVDYLEAFCIESEQKLDLNALTIAKKFWFLTNDLMEELYRLRSLLETTAKTRQLYEQHRLQMEHNLRYEQHLAKKGESV